MQHVPWQPRSTTINRRQPLEVIRQDEIGLLIGGFNRLLDALGQRELLFKQVLDTSSVAIFLVNERGCITQANQRMAEMFGCPVNSLIVGVTAATCCHQNIGRHLSIAPDRCSRCGIRPR